MYTLLVAIAASIFVTGLADELSYKDQLLSLLKERDTTVKFDETITEELARSQLEKYRKQLSSIEAWQDVDPKTAPIRIGRSKSRKLDFGRRLLFTFNQSGWYEEDKKWVLDMHNENRANVAAGDEPDDGTDGTYPTAGDMNYLFWDDALASVAQAYSDECYWGHNSDRNDEFYDYADKASFGYPSSGIYIGENIAEYSTTSDSISDVLLTYGPDAWWDESTLWHYQGYSGSTINGAGHFTQMAWANTRYIGCGFSYCPDGSWNTYYLVCNYYPGGNYGGQYPYTEGMSFLTHCKHVTDKLK